MYIYEMRVFVCVYPDTRIYVYTLCLYRCVCTHTLRCVLLRTYASLAAQRGSPPATRAAGRGVDGVEVALATCTLPGCAAVCVLPCTGGSHAPQDVHWQKRTRRLDHGAACPRPTTTRRPGVRLSGSCPLVCMLCCPSDGTERSSRESPLDMAPTWSSERQHWAEQWPLTTETTPDPCAVSKLSTACPAGVCLLASRDGELTT